MPIDPATVRVLESVLSFLGGVQDPPTVELLPKSSFSIVLISGLQSDRRATISVPLCPSRASVIPTDSPS